MASRLFTQNAIIKVQQLQLCKVEASYLADLPKQHGVVTITVSKLFFN